MCGGAAEAAFLRSVGSAGVGTMFEVVAYLIEAFFGDKVFAFWTKIAAVDDSVDQVVWVRAEVAT